MRIAASNFRFLPVYNVRKDQYSSVCGDPCEALVTMHQNQYPPFQLVFDTDQGDIEHVFLHNKCTGVTVATDYVGSATKTIKDIDQDGVDEYIYTFGGAYFPGIADGIYEVQIYFDTDVILYTETFAVAACYADECAKNWHLEWWHGCSDKGLGDYEMGFKNRFDLGDIILQHDGEIENVVSRRDGFGVETIISTDLRQKYSFDIMGCSWMLESLKLLKNNIYDNVFLHRSENADSFRMQNIEIIPKGSTDDCFFPIKILFTKDALITTKCCDSVYEQAPVPGNCTGMSVMTADDFAICNDSEPVELTATVVGGASPYVYVWSNGDTGQTIEVQPTETTTYIVTAIDAFGCVKQDEVTITVVTCEGDLVAEIEADPGATACAGDEVDLDLTVSGGSGTYTYAWSTGATTQDITITATSTMVYSVTITDTVSGDVTVAMINIVVIQLPDVSIIANDCDLSIQYVEACEGSPSYQWQVESAPDTWTDAGGSDNGTTYTGESGSNYRLAVTCDGCTGYSNEITVNCYVPCTTEINSVEWVDDELSITYTTVLGSNPFVSGFIDVREMTDPYAGICDAPYTFVIIVTLTAASDTIVIPFTPINNPTCVKISLSINAEECTDQEEHLIGA